MKAPIDQDLVEEEEVWYTDLGLAGYSRSVRVGINVWVDKIAGELRERTRALPRIVGWFCHVTTIRHHDYCGQQLQVDG